MTAEEASQFYDDLLQSTKWEKTAKINRWVALHELLIGSEDSASYKYRDAPGAPQAGFSATLMKLKEKAEEWYYRNNTTETENKQKVEFTVCLLNFYEDGQQRIGWHSDREEIGRTTPIASISLGATRKFLIRAKVDGVRDRATIEMESGSLVWMENRCQHDYVHSVPKENEVTEGRINLTFRCKSTGEQNTAGEEEHIKRDTWLETIIDGVTPNVASYNATLTATTGPAVNGEVSVFGDGVTKGIVAEGHTMHFLIKANVGAECYCAAETIEVVKGLGNWDVVARPLFLDGYVACCAPPDSIDQDSISATSKALLNLRSAHYIMDYYVHFDLQDLVNDEFPEPKLVDGETVYQYFKKRLVEKTISVKSLEDLQNSEEGGSFRVTCERIGGPHAFRAPNIEREIGGAMMEYYTKCKPKMEDYDINIRADVVGNLVIVGTQINFYDLSKERHFLKFRNAVTIKTNLAYAMVRCANIQPGNKVVDPFCGSGTLLLEALEFYKGKINCVGLDVSRRSAEGARENARAEGFGDDVCKFVCSDARTLRRHLDDESVDAMITNLPCEFPVTLFSKLKT